jgi:hypothetical protein
MIEYFGSFQFAIVKANEVEVEMKYDTTIINQNIDELFACISKEQQLIIINSKIISKLKGQLDWNKYDIIFLDCGNGTLHVLKDNTSKFSVPEYQIQK